jgi:hypothetical protein
MRRTRLGGSRIMTQRIIFVVIALAFVGSATSSAGTSWRRSCKGQRAASR